MLYGLPASGKSTYARTLVNEGWVEVNKDDLRTELLEGNWNPRKERRIVAARDIRIKQALQAGRNVVSSDTNLHPKHQTRLLQLAQENNATFETKFFDIDLQTAIERDLGRANSVGERVIRRMWERYIRPTLAVKQDPSLPHCIIVDVDGTLAHMSGRSPYDWQRVGEDTVDPDVRELVQMYDQQGYHTVIFTGRDGSCYDSTYRWLAFNGIPFDLLVSRAPNDTRPDHVVKREMWERHIKGNLYVKLVIDDRQQVVDMWRDMGFKVFQVADGNF